MNDLLAFFVQLWHIKKAGTSKTKIVGETLLQMSVSVISWPTSSKLLQKLYFLSSCKQFSQPF